MNRRFQRPLRRRPPGEPRCIVRGAAAAMLFCCLMPRAFADCFDAAATYQGVNADVLRAIAWVESRGNPDAEHRNANGSIDIGELQINSIHLRELANFGIDANALRDACVNIYVAAWHLKKQMLRYGNTWSAVGAYHSGTPKLRDAYVRRIQQTLVNWRVGPAQPGP
ncbi:lytic transglycosylase domain-containing protein [Burkholderia vietnamiensis]|nr:lytic transglycosylase domain-containing protein [Burkholderia vietnamiensis]